MLCVYEAILRHTFSEEIPGGIDEKIVAGLRFARKLVMDGRLTDWPLESDLEELRNQLESLIKERR